MVLKLMRRQRKIHSGGDYLAAKGQIAYEGEEVALFAGVFTCSS